MSLLTQNITLAKSIKRNIDFYGADACDTQYTKNLFNLKGLECDIVYKGYNSLRYNIEVVQWKTVLIDVGEDVFCVGLDINKSLKVTLSPRVSMKDVQNYINGNSTNATKGIYEAFGKRWRPTDLLSYLKDLDEYLQSNKEVRVEFSSFKGDRIDYTNHTISNMFANKHYLPVFGLVRQYRYNISIYSYISLTDFYTVVRNRDLNLFLNKDYIAYDGLHYKYAGIGNHLRVKHFVRSNIL